MKIWVDADACPSVVVTLVNRTAKRFGADVVYVANKQLLLPADNFIQAVHVAPGADVADNYIADHAETGEVAVTHDIPLASRLIKKGVIVISPRGDLFDEHNIGDRVASRDLMQSLRDTGSVTGGPEPYSEKNKRAFANRLDAVLTRLTRK